MNEGLDGNINGPVDYSAYPMFAFFDMAWF